VAEVPEHYRRTTLERMRAHLARAESELEATQRFLDPKTRDEAELDVVRAVANAKLSVGDALDTLRLMMGEPGG
jgi:hypothetical protein